MYAWNGLQLPPLILRRMKNLLATFVAAVLYFPAVLHLVNAYFAKNIDFEYFILFNSEFAAMFWIGQVLIGGLLPLALCTVVEEECGLFDFQLLQRDARTLVLRVPLRGDAAAAAIDRCRGALQYFAAAQGAGPIRVLGEAGCDVPRGRSGKACRVMPGVNV